jgi:hypothetical protein
MAESLVVSGLVTKRSEIAGQIDSLHTEINRLKDGLAFLDEY